MDFRTWIHESVERIGTEGLTGLQKSARPVKHKMLSGGNYLYSNGESIYEYDWDLLIILDACRFDLMCEVESEYDWISNVQQFRSLNSTTALWMRQTFTDNRSTEMDNTAYVCGNPFSESELDEYNFNRLIELWQTAWSDPGTVPPKAVTDETIRLMRNESHNRVIAHYMQPHCPFIPKPDLSKGKERDKFGNQDWRDVWERLRDGDLKQEELWEGYRENLRIGLNEVTSLLNNVDAKRVIVTSDHGNSMGEWGVYGHPPNLPLKNLRTVPWIVTSASDGNKRMPNDWLETESSASREEQLAALGYI